MVGAGGCGDLLLTAPVQACEVLAGGLASVCLSPNGAEVQGGLAAAVKLSNMSAAVRLRLIRELLDRHATSRYPRAVVRSFLIRECRISEGTARKEIAAALATGPSGPLPLLGQAVAAGEVTREHVDVAVSVLGSIPARLIRARGPEIDAVIVDWSRTWVAADVKTLAAQLAATLHPKDADEAADDAFETRSAHVGVSADGMVHLQAHLDPAAGSVFKAVLEELAGPDHQPAGATTSATLDEHGSGGGGGDSSAVDREGGCAPAHDHRQREQRLADALGEMARLAQLGMSSERPAGEPTRLVVISTIEQLAHPDDDPRADEPTEASGPTEQPAPERAEATEASEPTEASGRAEQSAPAPQPAQQDPEPAPAPGQCQQGALPVECAAPGLAQALGVGLLAPTTLHRLACDSIVDHVLLDRRGAVVAMQTLGRFATPAQARALAARDGGCARPGCGAPPARCDVHHVTWWSRGGRTRVDDMVLLCGPDHTLIHREDWRIVMDHGVPWFIPPPWIDPDQTPIRNTLHAAITDARRLGQRLRQPPLAA